MECIEFILYVKDQNKSKIFYEQVLLLVPNLHVPGMTEFELGENVKLGLMPEKGIANIITPALKHPDQSNNIPRCELYLKVTDAETYIKRALQLGAIEVSPLENRDWGDKVGYIADPDCHVIAFAEKI